MSIYSSVPFANNNKHCYKNNDINYDNVMSGVVLRQKLPWLTDYVCM